MSGDSVETETPVREREPDEASRSVVRRTDVLSRINVMSSKETVAPPTVKRGDDELVPVSALTVFVTEPEYGSTE